MPVTSDRESLFGRVTDLEVEALGADGLFVRQAAWPPAVLLAALAEAKAQVATGGLKAAGVSREARLSPALRGDDIAWLSPSGGGALGELFAGFEVLRLSLNEAAWLGLGRFELQLARYPGRGEGYVRHRDALFGDDNRRVTAILYLNHAWVAAHGGVLRLYPASGPVDLPPALGTLAVFRSEQVEHEVLPAYAERFALTAWFYGR